MWPLHSFHSTCEFPLENYSKYKSSIPSTNPDVSVATASDVGNNRIQDMKYRNYMDEDLLTKKYCF